MGVPVSRRVGRAQPKAQRAPDLIAVEDQILAIVRDAAGFPLSTAQVAEASGWYSELLPWERHRRIWCALDRLARAGRVHRERMPGWRCVYWRLA
jgi:hypothetical protein